MAASSPTHKSRFALATLFFLLFLLFSIFLFSKRALEPTLSLYTDLILPYPSSSTPTPLTSPPSIPNSHIRDSISDPELLDPSTHPPPISSNSLSDPNYTVVSSEIVNGGPSVKDTSDPDSDNESSVSMGENAPDLSVEALKECDLFMGSWVKDENYPIYQPGSCPYVDEAFDCQSNGRKDSEYLKWRWKPDGCDLPRFNATDFLVRLRGKKLMLVGDSMNRNQFESILCLLHEGLHNKSRMYEIHGHKITKGRGYFVFKFMVTLSPSAYMTKI